MRYIVNAFSIQMLPKSASVEFREITREDFENIKAQAISAVGHPDTARVLGVECNRMNVELDATTTLVVAQLTGGRLPEGTTELPEGFEFKYWLVYVTNYLG